jgi:hypothetical protein
MSAALPIDVQPAREIRKCVEDPLRFVLFAFPWGEPGTPLENYSSPDSWQPIS